MIFGLLILTLGSIIDRYYGIVFSIFPRGLLNLIGILIFCFSYIRFSENYWSKEVFGIRAYKRPDKQQKQVKQ